MVTEKQTLEDKAMTAVDESVQSAVSSVEISGERSRNIFMYTYNSG